jgi:magnesium-transporting ATPase (P-type)
MFVLMVLMSQIMNRTWMSENNHHYYVFPHFERPIESETYTAKSIMSYFLVFNGVIPLDLVVAFTIMKACYTAFMICDYEMVDYEHSVHEGELIGCEVKNLTTLEDLSKVNNVFCDKTGTLTKNLLIFRGMAIKGKSFDIENEVDKDNMGEFRKNID